MDQVKTGALIRTLRIKQNMTQLALAEQIGVSDKAVSKWERGCGAPDISLLPTLSKVLQVSTKALLRGDLEENEKSRSKLLRENVSAAANTACRASGSSYRNQERWGMVHYVTPCHAARSLYFFCCCFDW